MWYLVVSTFPFLKLISKLVACWNCAKCPSFHVNGRSYPNKTVDWTLTPLILLLLECQLSGVTLINCPSKYTGNCSVWRGIFLFFCQVNELSSYCILWLFYLFQMFICSLISKTAVDIRVEQIHWMRELAEQIPIFKWFVNRICFLLVFLNYSEFHWWIISGIVLFDLWMLVLYKNCKPWKV